ncbi:hypothetical protein Hypma_014482 [Hypsizygus marmoreus]|uniref:Uncharacterized protein n=1 Tax=Hypsizygus marmoreus TaxID=39966 RepID=A0A369JE56_HYPMA|nr:hypothetical protein Hypma_014482 [Hypsizygus marmoreus]
MSLTDSRRYTTSRLASCHGYEDDPVIDDAFSPILPAFYQHSGRIVSTAKGIWELWSPNSSQTPFYPGIPPPFATSVYHSDITQRRYDGHLGRFDFCVSPQSLATDRLWRGFVLRPASGFQKLDECPEYELIHRVWDKASTSGRLFPSFIAKLSNRAVQLGTDPLVFSDIPMDRFNLWKDRPVAPNAEDIQALSAIQRFDEAVDKVVEIQRRLRDTAAWLVMAKMMTTEVSISSEALRKRPIPLANEDYIGTWVNGANLEDVTWLLYHGVPCFLIHEVTPFEKSNDIPGPSNRYPWAKSFVEDTEALLLYPKRNGYDVIAARYPNPPVNRRTSPIDPAQPVVSHPDHRHRSSSRAQGWQGRIIGYETREPPVDWSNWKADTSFDADPLEYVRLHPAHVDWLRPPPIAVPSGKWSIWVEDTTDDLDLIPCIRKARNSERIDPDDFGDGPYYDRDERREMYFATTVTIPPGYISRITDFGLPVPRMLFLHEVNHKVARAKASRWMYYSRLPAGNANNRERTPSPRRLPPLLETQTSLNAPITAPPSPDMETTTTIPLPQQTIASEDSISLGSSDRSDSPMQVDPRQIESRAETSTGPSRYLLVTSCEDKTEWEDLLTALLAIIEGTLELRIERIFHSSSGRTRSVMLEAASTSDAIQFRGRNVGSQLLPGIPMVCEFMSENHFDEAWENRVNGWLNQPSPAPPPLPEGQSRAPPSHHTSRRHSPPRATPTTRRYQSSFRHYSPRRRSPTPSDSYSRPRSPSLPSQYYSHASWSPFTRRDPTPDRRSPNDRRYRSRSRSFQRKGKAVERRSASPPSVRASRQASLNRSVKEVVPISRAHSHRSQDTTSTHQASSSSASEGPSRTNQSAWESEYVNFLAAVGQQALASSFPSIPLPSLPTGNRTQWLPPLPAVAPAIVQGPSLTPTATAIADTPAAARLTLADRLVEPPRSLFDRLGQEEGEYITGDQSDDEDLGASAEITTGTRRRYRRGRRAGTKNRN